MRGENLWAATTREACNTLGSVVWLTQKPSRDGRDAFAQAAGGAEPDEVARLLSATTCLKHQAALSVALMAPACASPRSQALRSATSTASACCSGSNVAKAGSIATPCSRRICSPCCASGGRSAGAKSRSAYVKVFERRPRLGTTAGVVDGRHPKTFTSWEKLATSIWLPLLPQ
jgi:hypothetical protein